MSKGLEALERIETQYNQLGIKHKESGWHIREDDYFAIEKELKALEIIIEKNVKIDVLKYQSDVVFYNMAVFVKEEKLTKEEFDLLKEVLLCIK